MWGYQRIRQRLQGMGHGRVADPDFRNQAVSLMNRISATRSYPSRYNDEYNSFRNVAKYSAPAAAAAGNVLMKVDKHYGLKQAPPSKIPQSRRKNLRTVSGQQKITNYFPRVNIPAHLRTSSQRSAYAHQYLP